MKVPHRAHETLFFPRCCLGSSILPVRSLARSYARTHAPSSRRPSSLPQFTAPDVALSRARARLSVLFFFSLLFTASDQEHVARRLASCIASRRVVLRYVYFCTPTMSSYAPPSRRRKRAGIRRLFRRAGGNFRVTMTRYFPGTRPSDVSSKILCYSVN